MSKQDFKDIRDNEGWGMINQRNQEISPKQKDGSFQIKRAYQDSRTKDENTSTSIPVAVKLQNAEEPTVSREKKKNRYYKKESE